MTRLLVVEDDAAIRTMLDRGLRLAGYDPSFADDIAAGRAAWQAGGFAAVLLDVMLPDGDGIGLLAERRAEGDTTPAILVTAREETQLAGRAAQAGATATLAKPFSYPELVELLARVAVGRPTAGGPNGQPSSGSGSSRGAPSGG